MMDCHLYVYCDWPWLSSVCTFCCCLSQSSSMKDYYYWSLLYSAILRSRADSLRLHVILHEWIAFYSPPFSKYPPKWCTHSAGMAGATWNCCHLGTFCVHHTTMHHVTSCKATYGACIFSSNLPTALLAAWPGTFMCYFGNTGVERILKQESAQKGDPGEEKSPADPAEFEPATFRLRVRITSPAL